MMFERKFNVPLRSAFSALNTSLRPMRCSVAVTLSTER